MFDVILIGGISYDRIGRPLGPYRLRTAVENAGYTLKAVDYAWAFDDEKLLNLLANLISDRTKVLGISASWFSPDDNKWAIQKFFDKFKKLYPNVLIVTGGTKTNTYPLLSTNSDWFITGFSDIAFVKLLDHIVGKGTIKYWKESNLKVVNGDEHYVVTNMDELETVFKPEDNFLSYQPMPIEISRGCIFKCAFCTHPFLGKKKDEYIRSPESIARELTRNFELFGTYRYTISDDTFNDSYEKLDILQRAIDIAKLPKFEFVCYIRPEILVTKTDMIPKLISLGLKGAHLGIESMNSQSRKVIGKGMEINRILEVVERLRENDIRVHGSFIVGLPYDDFKNILKCREFLVENKDSYFHSWIFSPLGLMNGDLDSAYSLFEKNPKLYGYTTKVVPNSLWLDWTNNTGMTFAQAKVIARSFNDECKQYWKFAGWHVARAWYHNLTDDQLRNETYQSIDIENMSITNGLARAEQNYNLIVKN
jgi:radical SAM superfamily enzyme YgiQ (UPF0313 family)